MSAHRRNSPCVTLSALESRRRPRRRECIRLWDA